jgi:hypothetical protein
MINILNKFKTESLLFSSLFLFAPATARAEEGLGGLDFALVNPLSVVSIEGLLAALLNIFIVLATPIVVIFIIYAGFLYVTAQGNAEQVKKATTALTYAIIGGVIIIGSVALGEIIKNVVEAFKANP